MISIGEIKKFFRGRIVLSEPMSQYTTFRIGGPADYFFEPMDKEDTISIIRYLQIQEFPFVTIGRGSNLLVSDDGYRGAVVHVETGLKLCRMDGEIIYVEAGFPLNRFVEFCIERSLKGIEMLAGIPGSVGGAIIMNAGAYGGEISTYLVDIEIMHAGTSTILPKDEVKFSYRSASFHEHDVVISARFSMPKGEKEELEKTRSELILKRNYKHPIEYPNCGSVFKNMPEGPAAKYIEGAGLKGTKIGNAQVSEKHANFIINLEGATASDVYGLIDLIKKTVYEKFGIPLQLEVKLLGFPDSEAEQTLS
jgi:UDP-N-acetylmuramate dehydrogenase